MLTLRPYQHQFDADIRSAFKAKYKRVIATAATGSGKTVTLCHMIFGAVAKGSRVLFICDLDELIGQTSATLDGYGVSHGIIKSGYAPKPHEQVQLASIQTLYARLKRRRNNDYAPVPEEQYNLLIIDECHLSTTKSYVTYLATQPAALVCGLTATPRRLDNQPLGAVYEVIVHGPTTKYLIDEGWLSPFKMFRGPTETAKFHVKGGDYDDKEQEEFFNRDKLVGDVYDNWKMYADGLQTLVFAVNRKHAAHITEKFTRAGIKTGYLDGKTPKPERDRVLAQFKRKEITVLVNVMLYGKGVDVPGIECVIIARKTKSLTLWLQMLGRVLRPIYAFGADMATAEGRRAAIAAGKKPFAIAMDFGWNFLEHGLPDRIHEWSLDGTKKKKVAVIGVKYCEGTMDSGVPCTWVGPSLTRACPICGFEFVAGAKSDAPEHAAATLVLHDGTEVAPVKPPTKKQLAEELLLRQKKYLADHLLIQERKRYLTSGAMNPKYDPKFALKAFKREHGKWPNEKHGVTKEWKREMNTHVGHFVPRLLWWEMDGVRYWCEKGVVNG